MSEALQQDFDLAVTAQATGAKAVTIKSWIAQGHLGTSPKTARLTGGGGPGRGRRRGFSLHTVIEIGFARAILDAGTPDLATAFQAATRFAHMGSTAPDGRRRSPGLPFGGDVRTFLFMSGGETLILPWRPKEDRLSDALHAFKDPEGMLVINCDAVFRRIVEGLGFDRDQIGNAAFEGDGDAEEASG